MNMDSKTSAAAESKSTGNMGSRSSGDGNDITLCMGDERHHSDRPTHGDNQSGERRPLQPADPSSTQVASQSQNPDHPGGRLPLHLTNQDQHHLPTNLHHSSSNTYHHHNTSSTPSLNHNWPPREEHMNPSRLFSHSSNHVSFLEEIARNECQYLPCNQHDRNSPSRLDNLAENDEDSRNEERRRFMLLDFASDDEDDLSDSDDDDSTSDDDDDEDTDDLQGEEQNDDDNSNSNNEDDAVSHSDNEDMNVGEESNAQNDIQPALNDSIQPANPLVIEDSTGSASANANNFISVSTSRQAQEWNNSALQRSVNSMSIQHLLSATASPSSPPMIGAFTAVNTRKRIPGMNPNHQRIKHLLLSLANSEEKPLIRADIPWSVIISCGSPLLNPSQHVLDQCNDSNLLFSLLQLPILEASSQLQPKPSLLSTLYQQLRDPNGARLLQGFLRMDPPLEAVKVLLDAFPLACLDMEGFFTACQFVNPNTSSSRRMREGDRGYFRRGCPAYYAHNNNNAHYSGIGNNAATQLDEEDDGGNDDDSDPETDDDVGEVVKLVMHQTIKARRLNSIDWGMVAFLGDARISPSQAKLLLRHAPEALIDPKHGAFGVSPLDRMASGFFIHGETVAWVEKLRLALRVAAYVRLRQKEREEQEGDRSPSSPPRAKISLPKGFFSPDCELLRRRESSNIDDDSPDMKPSSSKKQSSFPAQAFYPYHELIRLLVSPHFQGNKFGQHGFLQTLKACTQSDPDAFLRPDNEGNLPFHIALGMECETVLGIKGERKLIKYLLDLDRNMALCPGGSKRLPLGLSIENAWPVYDLIIDAALKCCDMSTGSPLKSEYKSDSVAKAYIASNMILDQPLLHDVLNGRYHPRFGIHGARQLVKNIISKVTHHHYQNQNPRGEQRNCHCLANFADADGRTALHIALQSKWPVYDLIVQANPNSIEARDPTQFGFFPFQTAACAFTTNDGAKQGTSTMKAEMSSETKQQSQQANRLCSSATATKNVADATENGKEAALEMSMLFELIRESPLCVTWRMSTDYKSNKQSSDSKPNVQTAEAMNLAMDGSDSFPVRKSKKRSRSSS